MTLVVKMAGVPGVIAKLTKFRDITKSRELANELRDVGVSAQRLWKRDIYTYFDARLKKGQDTSGQLGDSLFFHINLPLNMMLGMRGIFHNGEEYGQYLRRGTGPSPGMYWPPFDKRIKRGTHPGISDDPWKTWMKVFKAYLRVAVRKEVENHIRRIAK